MIYTFASLPPEQVTAVGGKGSTLARLFQAGYPVPDGFVITPTAFDRNSLREEAWKETQHRLMALRNGHGPTAFAVRSSAQSEDSSHASFAGEFESVLNVHGDDEIFQAIHTVFQSAHNERVQAYSQAQAVAVPTQGVAVPTQAVAVQLPQMAVVVQKLVEADYAGVLFTADPVTDSQAHMTGNFVNGLGDKLVSGEVMPETFTLSRPKGVYEGAAALKRYGRTLFKLAQRLEKELGGPQDIEWAVADGRVYLLQARPVTTMQPYNPATGEWNDSRRGDYLWTNANFGEAVPDVMTPMTWSLLQIYGRETFTIPLPGQHPLFGNIAGRFYMNASLAASMFKALGFSQARIQAQMREFFGHLPEDMELPLIPFSRWAVLWALVKGAPAAMRRVRRDRKKLAAFTASVPQQTALFYEQIAAAQTKSDLLAIWQELAPIFVQACHMLQAGTGLFEDLVRPLRQKLVNWTDEETANTLLSGFSQDGEHLASLGPVLGLWRVQQGQLSQNSYRQQFGHRGPHEFELSWPRPSEDPAWLAQQQANLAAIDVPALLARQEAQKAAAWAKFRQQQPRQVKKTQQQLAAIAAAARGREAIRSEIIRLVAVVRAFALRAGELTGSGEEVFFWRLEELVAVLAGNETAVTVASTAVSQVPIRQEAHTRLSALPPYPGIIRGRFDPYQQTVETSDFSKKSDVRQLAGFPGAAGVVEGVVRRLDAPEEGHLLQSGEILVTATTNIGWTLLFPKAGAVVTDVGAPLSHAAIVARELGIPAVVGTGNATSHLQTGNRVRVNGSKGTVEIL